MAIFPAIQSNANEQALSFLDQGHGLFAKNAWYWADSAYVNGRMGNQKQAAAAIKKLKALNAAQELDPGLFVVAYVGVGDNEQAISWLDKALQQHSNVLTVLKVDPIHDPLRPDARF